MPTLLLSLCLLGSPDAGAPDWLKTDTASFGLSHRVELRDGGIWWKPLEGRGRDAGWEPMPPDGLPGSTGRLGALKEVARELIPENGFARPATITQLTADGDNLLAISDTHRAYYAKFSTLTWTDVWGPLGKRGPLMLDFAPKAVAMSHRRIAYSDLDGNVHPVTAGVTTVYALTADGREVLYADPWIPPRFEHKLCGPLHGTLQMANLSASASTVFVIDQSGRSFTRLADFDTLGVDPALLYSWKREKREGPAQAVRTLPAEDWKEHPRPPGPATTRITIVQTGPTNADRELRIEAEGGYWWKKISDANWQKKETGLPAGAPLVDAMLDTTGPSRSEVLTGVASGKGLAGVQVTVTDFDPDCSPAKLTFSHKGERVDLVLHFHDTLLDRKKNGRDLDGALLVPDGGLPGTFLSADVKKLVDDSNPLEVHLEVEGPKVRLKAKGPPKPGAFSVELSRPKKAK